MLAPLKRLKLFRSRSPPIASLPDDAFDIIFELNYSSEDDGSVKSIASVLSRSLSIVKLSHVNRRFCLLAISNPKLWTHIAGEERYPKMGFVNACLERSRDLPLSVHLYVYVCPINGPSCDEVLKAAKPHAHRWRTVHIRAC
ncbi:hypothetical protein SCHPADRAFT_482603 [Schizopora paradoxa]|uniref:F-box domain-containing protein n=1 Tax=Schizopora paradoxa TaxID=27342 RepID=A0A0H2S2H4_9AGAM|nr:hypothetical protein SCHPADRAFT_482603 [Schizopora paradoxa]